MRDKVTRQCPQTTTFEEKREPKQIRTEILLLTSLTARPNRFTVAADDDVGFRVLGSRADILGTLLLIVVDYFYIALFSALEQTHYARM